MLLENQIENIRHTGNSEQAKTYLMLVEQMEICLKELRTWEKTNPVDEARLMLNKLLAAPECERKEMEQMLRRPVTSKTSRLAIKDWLVTLENLRSSPRTQCKL